MQKRGMGFGVLGVLLSLLCIGSFLGARSVFASPIETWREQKLALESVLAELETHYGMIKYKEKLYGVTYEKLRKKYLNLIDAAMLPSEQSGLAPKVEREVLSPDEFRQLLIGLAAEFRDGHTNILRNSTDYWTLGIRAAAVQGKLFVVGFRKDFYLTGSSTEDIHIGDEIVERDGRPVSEIAKENMAYIPLATYETRYARALENVVEVSHRFFLPKEAGTTASLKFQRPNGSAKKEIKTISGRFAWSNIKDLRGFTDVLHYLRPATPNEDPKELEYFFGARSLTSYFRHGLKNAKLPLGTIDDVGKILNQEITEKMHHRSQSKGAADSAVLEADGPDRPPRPVTRLEAYKIQYGGKTFGVLRVPSYSPDSFLDVESEFRWIAAILARFENSTDALIFDQLSNGGGYVHEVVQFARLFAPEGEYKAGTIDIRLSQTYLNRFEPSGKTETAPEMNSEVRADAKNNFARIYLSKLWHEKLLKKYQNGERWSGPIPHMGTTEETTAGEAGRINRDGHPVYTKPVLFLNDSRSGSGGDFMPSILQANGRAVIFGETSMGLGGPVYRSQDSMPGSEMFMRCTYGYCERADHLPIENIGVPADVLREVQPSDLNDGFAAYAKDVLTAAVQLANGQNTIEIQKRLDQKETQKGKGHRAARSFEKEVAAFRAISDLVTDEATLLKLYRDFFAEVKAVLGAPKSELSETVLLPLPRVLLSKDVILPTLRKKDEVLERLREMAMLPQFTGHSDLKALIELLVQEVSGMSSKEVRFFRQSCADLLTMRSTEK